MNFSKNKNDTERREFWKNMCISAIRSRSLERTMYIADKALEKFDKNFNLELSGTKTSDLFTAEEIAEAFGDDKIKGPFTLFPKFNYDSNLYFNTIGSLNDLEKLFEAYKNQMTKDEILDTSRSLESSAIYKNNIPNFGMRIEHNGNTTLRQFLVKLGFNQFYKYKRGNLCNE